MHFLQKIIVHGLHIWLYTAFFDERTNPHTLKIPVYFEGLQPGNTFQGFKDLPVFLTKSGPRLTKSSP